MQKSLEPVFGTGGKADYGFILFDIDDEIDLFNRNFRVQLTGGGDDCGTECPDIRLLAAVNVPEPGSIAVLVGVGSTALLRQRQCG